MEVNPEEKINGLITLLSVLPKYSRTSYPYSQLDRTNVKFTKNKIEILARKEDQRAELFTIQEKPDKFGKSDKTDKSNKSSKSDAKKGGDASASGVSIVFYG
jgi:hypothetical protein